jgi:beta-xylosidase
MTAPTSSRAPFAPVYDGYFADPFVWKHNEVYYAIGTGAGEASGHPSAKIFPVLHSHDFKEWHLLDSALISPSPEAGDTFWAPAVAFSEGKFYLYYSVGHGDKCHQLRVAESTFAQGPYRDLGFAMLDPKETPFCIDPHPFQDVDGQWYLFYACDFLDCDEHARAGTALMVRRMTRMTQLDPAGHVVLRARSDWQRFQAERTMYNAIWDWHTLEGPCLVRHQQSYFCFYSGGRWENETYGVDYGVAQSILGPYRDFRQ